MMRPSLVRSPFSAPVAEQPVRVVVVAHLAEVQVVRAQRARRVGQRQPRLQREQEAYPARRNAEFAQCKTHEARMRTERVMEKCDRCPPRFAPLVTAAAR